MKIAVVTGASSGIGRELLYAIDREREFDEIWVIARSEGKLTELASSLGKDRIRVIPLDLTRTESISDLKALLSDKNPSVRLLANCAGMGKNGAFAKQSVEDTHTAISLNCEALSAVTQTFLPYMTGHGEKRSATIINIASSAGFLPQPNFAVYAASKSYVISFSRALAEELRDKKITVTCICPGPVDTDFIKVSKSDPDATFTGFKAKFVTTTDKLIPASIKAAKKGKTMLVYGMGQKMLHLTSKLVPTKLVLFFERKMK
jgi:short-subunit dehydrogenase